MILCDTGPLVGLLDRDDPHHARCVDGAMRLPPAPLITTWPCFTEAMYLLGEADGHRGQGRLWDLLVHGRLQLYAASGSETRRMRELMEQYQDAPMDLADASLVAAAEALGTQRVFTLDSHFQAYRIGRKGVFEVVP